MFGRKKVEEKGGLELASKKGGGAREISVSPKVVPPYRKGERRGRRGGLSKGKGCCVADEKRLWREEGKLRLAPEEREEFTTGGKGNLPEGKTDVFAQVRSMEEGQESCRQGRAKKKSSDLPGDRRGGLSQGTGQKDIASDRPKASAEGRKGRRPPPREEKKKKLQLRKEVTEGKREGSLGRRNGYSLLRRKGS